MAKISDEFASNYLKAEDLRGRDVTLRILTAEIRTFKDEEKGPQKKVVLSFAKTEKQFICNTTNRTVLVELLGDDTDDWIGRDVTLYPTKVPFGGKRVDAIRVRELATPVNRRPAPAGPPPAQTPPPHPEEEDDGDSDIPF
jgi:hypothetical protein